MFKKIVALLTVMCLSVSLFTACGEKKADPSTSSSNTVTEETTKVTEEAKVEPFEISVASWMLAASSPNAQPFMDLIEKNYKAKYPTATIVWNPIKGEKYHEMLKAQLATGNAPDVFFFQNAVVPFGNAGYLTDLSTQPWAADVLESTKPDVTYEGKLLAAPIDVGGWGVFYNKKVFADLGVAVPKNFQEFLDICKVANEKGIIPLTGGYKEWQAGAATWGMQSFLFGANKNIAADLYDGKAKINGPEFTSLYKALETMVKAGVYPKNILSTTYEQAQQLLGEGKAAMIFDGPWLPAGVADKYKTDLGFFQMPDANGNVTMTSSVNSACALNSDYADQQKGIDMINTIVTKEAINTLIKNSSFSGLKGYDIEQNTVGSKEYNDLMNSMQSQPQMSCWLPASVFDRFQQICTKIIAGKAFDPKDLDAIDVTYQKDKAIINKVK